MGIYSIPAPPIPGHLLDDALFVDRFGGSDIKYGSGALTVCTITPNLPADAVVKWAALHVGVCMEDADGAGNVTFNGNVVASLGNLTGSNASGGLVPGLALTPSWVNVNSANTVALSAAGAGAYSAWLEIGYTLRGSVDSILRRGRRGRWYGGAVQGYTSLTSVATGDIWSWSPTIVTPTGMTIRNAMLLVSMNNTAYFAQWANNHLYLDGGRIYVTNPGGAAQAVGAGYASNRCLHAWSNRDGYDQHPGATCLQAYDVKAILTAAGVANVKLNGAKVTITPAGDGSNYRLSGSWALWVSHAATSIG